MIASYKLKSQHLNLMDFESVLILVIKCIISKDTVILKITVLAYMEHMFLLIINVLAFKGLYVANTLL